DSPPYFRTFPTVNPIQPTPTNGYTDVFVTKFNSNGQIVYSTTFGGSGGDEAHGIAVDSLGNMYIAGETESLDFPRVKSFQSLHDAGSAFVTVLNAQGSDFIFSTCVGW